MGSMRMPISGIYKIKGVGDVLAGRVEQGLVKPGEEVVFLPTHTASNPCTGKVFTVEMHHQRAEQAKPGDNVGLNIKGLDKQNMPRSGCQGSGSGHRIPWSDRVSCHSCTPSHHRHEACSARWWCISTVNTLPVQGLEAVWVGRKMTSSPGLTTPCSTRPASTSPTPLIL